VGVLIALSCAGCKLGQVKADIDHLESHAELRGEVTVEGWDESVILVALLQPSDVEGAPDTTYTRSQIPHPGEFYFLVAPGTYRVVAIEDSNGNLQYDEGERVGSYNNFEAVELRPSEQRAQANVNISNRRLRNVPEFERTELTRFASMNGDVLDLADPRFGPDNGRRGMFQPMAFLDDPGGGIFFLEPYDANKVPVLFVHGIAGYPQEFTRLIGGLDRERFQPWLLHYPSGFDLNMVAWGLNRALGELQHETGFERMCLVAHSMGGVLGRLYIKRNAERTARRVHTFVTIVSPLGGMESAGMGVQASPVVVPSWRNLDPTGHTIPALYEEPLPEGIQYHLFFAHQDGRTDTVVGLHSQLRAEAMAEATELHGFSGTHTGVLRDPLVSEHLGRALAACGQVTPEAEGQSE